MKKSYGWLYLLLFTVIHLHAAPVKADVAIASAHPLATNAGMAVLAEGGNAFDAAVTVAAVLAVVAPYHSGLAGGGFWLLHHAQEDKNLIIDAREVAPSAAHEQMFIQNGQVNKKLATTGALAAAIPGQVAGMVHLAKAYGSMPLERLLAPAISVAETGFDIDAQFAHMLEIRSKKLKMFPGSVDIFFSDDKPLQNGERLIQKDLGKTLRTIAKKGHQGFYTGALAQKMVDEVNAQGGIWRVEDLANYQIKERKPIVGKYHDMTLTVMPPPSAGGMAIVTALNILSTYEMDLLSEADKIHLVAESLRRAYCDRAKFLGDPDHVLVPTKALLTMQHANNWRKGIRMNKATRSKTLNCGQVHQEGEHTTHYSIIDKQGNRVAATLTINHWFGGGMVIPGTGMILNNEMDDFATSEGVSNTYGLVGHKQNFIAPNKRPLSSMSPTFFETENGIGILGTPGGSRIPTMVLLALLHAEKDPEPKHWVSLPRYHHQYKPDVLSFEPEAFSKSLQNALTIRGHRLESTTRAYGDMQAVYKDKITGRVIAASDPRGVGLASVTR